MDEGEIVLYQPDEIIKLEVHLKNETVWLSIEEMSQLFGRDISVIGKHIRNIQGRRAGKRFSLGKICLYCVRRKDISGGLL